MKRGFGLSASLAAAPLLFGQGCPPADDYESPHPTPVSNPTTNPPAAPATSIAIVDLIAEPNALPDLPAAQQEFIYRLPPSDSGYVWTVSECENLESLTDPLGRPEPATLIASAGRINDSHYYHFAWFWWPMSILPPQIQAASLNLYCVQTSGRDIDVSKHFLLEPLPDQENQGVWLARCLDSSCLRVTGTWLNENINSGEWVALDVTDDYQRWAGQSWREWQPNNGLAFDAGWLGQWAKFSSSDASVPEDQRPYLKLLYYPPVARQLIFPLEGRYAPTRVTGYRFGDWWEKEICPDSKDTKLWHTGTDFGASAGDKVYAALTGQIKLARTDPTWGGYVVLEHHDGNLIYTTTYTHVTPRAGLTTGHWLTQGMQLGTVAGISSPHLHFQIRLKPYDEKWTLAGRLPGVSCLVTDERGFEPAWPNGNINSELVDYQ